jgi:diaminohydroxyphosphoribosylaminopyrimidine deaminase/5-amino-6-(5-phosphoribosylamino)uracil reductase
VAGAFLRCGLVDRIEWFRAPVVLGAEGRPGIGALAVSELAEAPRFRRTEIRALGVDLWETYERF